MDFHPIRPVINAWPNWSNWASSQWISTQFDHPIQPIRLGIISMDSTQFDQVLITGRIGWKSIEIHCMPVKGFRCQSNLTGRIGCKSIEITLYACLVELGGRIGCKSIEIALYACLVKSVEFDQASSQWISTQLDPIPPPNLTSN